MRERIEGQVAQILNASELVINRGSEHGVTIGMKFAILNKRGRQIRDPETQKIIGSVELEKSVLKVVRVQELLCVARTFRTIQIPGGALWGASMSQLTRVPKEIRETFKTDEDSVTEELEEKNSLIKIGDPAVEIRGDEFDSK